MTKSAQAAKDAKEAFDAKPTAALHEARAAGTLYGLRGITSVGLVLIPLSLNVLTS
jgi:hypothetical protein